MTNWNDRNRSVIEEFRNSRGNAAGNSSGRPLLLLTTYGRKTGQPYTNPLMHLPDGDRWIVFASKGGDPKNPDWYHNLVANSIVTLEVDAETFEAHADTIFTQAENRLHTQKAILAWLTGC